MNKFEIPENVIDRIIDTACGNAKCTILSHLDEGGVESCESHIEAILIVAIQAEIEFGISTFRHIEFVSKPVINVLDKEVFRDWYIAVSGHRTLFLQQQAQLDDWRVDFLITIGSEFGNIYRLVVECDGHDFHERTKDQAAKDRARDRAFQAKGFTVFRFTGSEIYRDPSGCAAQIIDWAEQTLLDDLRKALAKYKELA